MKEGFSFAHSSSGIITMVLEVWMEPKASCVIQYVLFPPHKGGLLGSSDDIGSCSEDETDLDTDFDTKLQIVTEVWIEPQYGRVKPSYKLINHLNDKYYYDIAYAVINNNLLYRVHQKNVI